MSLRKHHKLLAFLLLLFTSSCLDQDEGCLDALAKNFEVSASVDCCCQYPDLILSISHGHGAENLTLGKEYMNSMRQSYQVLDFAYFLSSFIVHAGDTTYSIEASLDFELMDGQAVTEPDDVIEVSRNQFSYPIGTFSPPGSFSKLQFGFGLSEPERQVDLQSLPEDHLLLPDGNTLYDLETAIYNDLALSLVTPNDTLHLTLQNLGHPLVDLTQGKSRARGDNLTFACTVDYSIWFEDVDLTQSAEKIAEDIAARLASSIRAVE